MKPETFRLGLKAVANVTPYAKKLSDDEIAAISSYVQGLK